MGAEARGFVLYNCRHSALTNLVAQGVPDSIARAISGHRTASVHQRYVISPEKARREALASAIERVERHRPEACMDRLHGQGGVQAEQSRRK